MQTTTVQFAAAAKVIGRVARDLGLLTPAFRSPPAAGAGHRSIRRSRGTAPTVAVAVRNRPLAAVLADMIDGVIAANELVGDRAGAARDTLWAACTPLVAERHPAPVPNVAVHDRAA